MHLLFSDSPVQQSQGHKRQNVAAQTLPMPVTATLAAHSMIGHMRQDVVAQTLIMPVTARTVAHSMAAPLTQSISGGINEIARDAAHPMLSSLAQSNSGGISEIADPIAATGAFLNMSALPLEKLRMQIPTAAELVADFLPDDDDMSCHMQGSKDGKATTLEFPQCPSQEKRRQNKEGNSSPDAP